MQGPLLWTTRGRTASSKNVQFTGRGDTDSRQATGKWGGFRSADTDTDYLGRSVGAEATKAEAEGAAREEAGRECVGMPFPRSSLKSKAPAAHGAWRRAQSAEHRRAPSAEHPALTPPGTSRPWHCRHFQGAPGLLLLRPTFCNGGCLSPPPKTRNPGGWLAPGRRVPTGH
jgi:hypothetical protein